MVGSHGKPRRKPEPGTVSLQGVRLHEEGVRQHELTEDLKRFFIFLKEKTLKCIWNYVVHKVFIGFHFQL